MAGRTSRAAGDNSTLRTLSHKNVDLETTEVDKDDDKVIDILGDSYKWTTQNQHLVADAPAYKDDE